MQRNKTNFKALTFVAEQTASTFNYEVKGVRALWDPSLSIPGTNRRGGWRCPVGTRYGGQITDRFGRSCGWGVARRIANQIADIGERLENIDDRKRNNRLAARNSRMQRFLARQQKPNLLERGARGIAEALEGGDAPQRRPRIPVQQQRPQIPVKPLQPSVNDIDPISSRTRRRRGNLRESEQRRMERELVEPGAPRTGEPPKPNKPRWQRRAATQQGAKRTVRRKPEVDFVDGAKPVPTSVPRRKPPSAPPKPIVVEPDPNFNAPEPPKPSTPIPDPPPMPETPKPSTPKPSTPIPDPPPWNPTADERARLGGSLPDARSERNVRNRFREGGLPETAYWREDAFPSGEEKEELERRFGRYYDENNQRNERGNYVNRRLNAGGGQPANRSKPPERPKTPDAPKPPNVPASPPPMRRVLDLDGEFNKPEDQAVKDIIKRTLNNYEPNVYNNLRGQTKEQLQEQKSQLKRQQEQALDAQFDIQLGVWLREKDKDENQRENARTMLVQAHLLREKNKLAQEAVDMRILEIDAGIEWRQRVPKPLANVAAEQVRAANAPVIEPPEPQAGFDVSPPISKSDHKPNLIGKIGEDGLPDVKSVPMGNKGIDTPQKAIDHLAKGGEIADVPDDLLKEALKGATGRFTKGNLGGGGVNANEPGNMTLFIDTLTGKKYYLKYQVRSEANGEDVHEIIGNNLTGRFGFPVGGLRADSPQEQGFNDNPRDVRNNGRAILFEHAGNYIDGTLTAGRDAEIGDIKASDRVRATLLDFTMVNRDRHGGNFFASTDADGKSRFVPIDPSLGFDAEYGGQAHFGYGGNDAGFVGWLGNDVGGRRNDMVRSLREQYLSGRLSRREVTAAVTDVQRSIREAERKNPYANMVENAILTMGAKGKKRKINSDKIVVRPQEKMNYITDTDPSKIAGWILGL